MSLTIRKIYWLTSEFHSSNPISSSFHSPLCSIWSPPPSDHLMINADASFCPASYSAGIAAICRNSKGEIIDYFQTSFPAPDPLFAELMAILQSANWVCFHNWENAFLYSDCKRAVDDINLDNLLPNKWNYVILKCRETLRMTRSSIHWTARTGNAVADHLAREVRINRLGWSFTFVKGPVTPKLSELITRDLNLIAQDLIQPTSGTTL